MKYPMAGEYISAEQRARLDAYTMETEAYLEDARRSEKDPAILELFKWQEMIDNAKAGKLTVVGKEGAGSGRR